jgi:hypothetical protein
MGGLTAIGESNRSNPLVKPAGNIRLFTFSLSTDLQMSKSYTANWHYPT